MMTYELKRIILEEEWNRSQTFFFFSQDFETLNGKLHVLLQYGNDLKEHKKREEGLELIRDFLAESRSQKVLDLVGAWTKKLFADVRGYALKVPLAGNMGTKEKNQAQKEAEKKAEEVRFGALLGCLGSWGNC